MITSLRKRCISAVPIFGLLLDRADSVEPGKSIPNHGIGQIVWTFALIVLPPMIIAIDEQPDTLADRRHLDGAFWSKNLQEELLRSRDLS
jgi:hypothetical protein